jgi:hypothetical protein
MDVAPGAGEALEALTRGGVLAQLRAGRECVVWELGGGEGLGDLLAEHVAGLSVLAVGERGAEEVASAPSPADRDDPPALTIVGDGGGSAGSGLEGWLERAHELRCPFVYARRRADRQAREEPVDRWYWRYDVTVSDGERLTLGEVRRAAASACQNRYRHTVGWRRLLPIAPRA